MPKHRKNSKHQARMPYRPSTYPAKLDLTSGVTIVTAPIGGVGKSTTYALTSAALQAVNISVPPNASNDT